MVTRDELKSFRTDFQNAVKDLEKKYQVSIKLGSISYTANEFHSRMTASKTTPEAVTAKSNLEKNQFAILASSYGMQPEDYGKSFIADGKRFTIYGINTRAPKKPILLKSDDGKGYHATALWVSFCLKNNAELGI